MGRVEIELDSDYLAMPNGVTLLITAGTLHVEYTMQRAEPDVGIFDAWPEWDVTDAMLEVTASDDDEREVRLSLPWQHPAAGALLKALADRIIDACNDDDYGGPDPDDFYDDLMDRDLTSAEAW